MSIALCFCLSDSHSSCVHPRCGLCSLTFISGIPTADFSPPLFLVKMAGTNGAIPAWQKHKNGTFLFTVSSFVLGFCYLLAIYSSSPPSDHTALSVKHQLTALLFSPSPSVRATPTRSPTRSRMPSSMPA